MKSIRHALWNIKQQTVEKSRATSRYLHRKTRVLVRKFYAFKPANSYTFAILCIKRTQYAELVIRHANSLHYFNPTHRFVVHADDVCAKFLNEHTGSFDYPGYVEIKLAFPDVSRPWTIYKMEMRIENARAGGIDIDADMYWHGEPTIDRTKPLMFAPVFQFKDHEIESRLIMELFNKPEWLSYWHCMSAFVSIPPEFMTEAVARDARAYMNAILNSPLAFIEDEHQRQEMGRVSEEIGTCLALQSHYPGRWGTLKADSSKKDKTLVEPLYYGCENQVMS